MKLLDILKPDAIIADLRANDKIGVLEELSQAVAGPANTDPRLIVKVLLDREQLGSTGIGGGIGIPHGKLNSVQTIVVGFGLSKNGVEFDSLDNKPVHIFFLLITPENSTGSHLRVLAQISKLLKMDHFKHRLIASDSVVDIIEAIQEVDEDF